MNHEILTNELDDITKSLLANLERVVIEHRLEGDDLNCKDYGEPLTEIGVKSKKYMWLYMSKTESSPVILYDYQSTRSSSCPKNFLGDFKGFLQTDGYIGYNSLSNAIRVYCLAHILR